MKLPCFSPLEASFGESKDRIEDKLERESLFHLRNLLNVLKGHPCDQSFWHSIWPSRFLLAGERTVKIL